MIKQVQFLGRTESGVFCHGLFGSAGAFEKTAGAPPFADWDTGEELRKYIKGITAADRKKYAYVLVNALGAGEYFGSNINADFFPWNSLAHEGDDYGYKTFLTAHAFQHHKNKDSERAFGVPVLSVLNTRMKRVELIIRLDREKATAEGADGIIHRIDAGEFPDVSMGCKVPYDVCSICGHQSKTRADYCRDMMPSEDLRHIYGPNKILFDGRKIYVINLHPRFFDISFVFIGADKTAKVMAKLAQVGRHLCLGDVCTLSAESPLLYSATGEPMYMDELAKHYADRLRTAAQGVRDEMRAEKTAAACDCACGGACKSQDGGMSKLAELFIPKQAAQKKLSEIVKEIPTGTFAMKRLQDLEAGEPDIAAKVLDTMAKSQPISETMSGAAGLGIVLKPHEFQRMVLMRMGEDEMADSLDSKNEVFRPSTSFSDTDLKPTLDAVASVLPLLMEYIRSRTAFGPSFQVRVVIGDKDVKNPLPNRSPIAHPLLDKISTAYNGYRRSMLMKLSEAREVVCSDPKLREAVLGDGLANMFMKTANTSPVVSSDSMAYLMGAHLDKGLLTNTAVAEAIAATNPWLFEEP